jgi:hypothetical protein
MGLKAVANLGSGGGGGISGSGTAGYVAKFTGTGTSIGDSLVRDNGTDVSIDMAPSVGYKFSVNGNTNIVGRIDAISSRISTMSSGLSADLVLQRDGVEAARIIAGGLVGFGNTNPAATIEAYAAVTGEVRASGDTVSIVSSCTYNNAVAAFAPFVRLSRSRGTRAAPAAVNALDTIGVVQWQARGTTDRAVANISCTAPANAGGDQISGQLTFATTQTTDALPVVRLTIDPVGVASFTGPVRATGTTASAPAFTGSDTDTGVYFPANNQVRLSTNGTLAIAIDASQNVGVGTASPVAPMHAFGTSITAAATTTASAGILRVAGSATNALFCGSFSDSPFGMCLQTNSASYPLALQPAGGNVGIGTANPTSLLTVNGNIAFNSGYGSAAVAYGTRAWVNFNGTGVVAIRGSGNVSTITDLGVGSYSVNFTTAMPDVNYSAHATVGYDGTVGSGIFASVDRNSAVAAVGSVRVYLFSTAFAVADSTMVFVSVTR